MNTRAFLALGLCLILFGCKKKEFHPPDREAQVEAADSLLTAATFDSIQWQNEDARAISGNVVYSAKCRNCHGPLGSGQTEYAAQRELDVPSLVEPEWPLADSLDAVRRRIFIGHARGMPTWGVAGITPREIDGVAFYVLEVLRPDVVDSQ